MTTMTLTAYPDEGEQKEFGRTVTLLTEGADRLRVVLDGDGTGDEHDILIERRNGKWLILLHANAGDPVMAAVITDAKITVEDGDGKVLGAIDVEPPAGKFAYPWHQLARVDCVMLLEGQDIQCYDSEDTDVLREAVRVNVLDGTIPFDLLPAPEKEPWP